jgi:tryptophan-rich sensory protein
MGMNKQRWLALLGSIILAQLAGAIGALFTTSKIPTWYAALAKPSFNPPSWVFGPVWTILFVLMGIAAFLIWQSSRGALAQRRREALVVYGLQLLLNVLWSILFFGLQNPGLAFAEIILLWLAIFVTMRAFARISRVAMWLLAPYIVWVSFAAFLNYSIWVLN